MIEARRLKNIANHVRNMYKYDEGSASLTAKLSGVPGDTIHEIHVRYGEEEEKRPTKMGGEWTIYKAGINDQRTDICAVYSKNEMNWTLVRAIIPEKGSTNTFFESLDILTTNILEDGRVKFPKDNHALMSPWRRFKFKKSYPFIEFSSYLRRKTKDRKKLEDLPYEAAEYQYGPDAIWGLNIDVRDSLTEQLYHDAIDVMPGIPKKLIDDYSRKFPAKELAEKTYKEILRGLATIPAIREHYVTQELANRLERESTSE